MRGYVRDKSLSASPWVTDHTKGHRQSLFEALHLLLQGFALWPCYKSAYTSNPIAAFFSTSPLFAKGAILHVKIQKIQNPVSLSNTAK